MFSSPYLATDRTWLPPPLRAWAGRRLSGPPRGRTTRRYRLAIFQLDRLGDLVLALSVIRTLLKAHGETECLLVVSIAAGPLAAREFPHTPRIELAPSAPSLTRNLLPLWWSQRRKFRGIACDRVICLSHHRDVYKEVVLSWISSPPALTLDRLTYPKEAPEGWCLELVAHRQIAGGLLGRPLTDGEVVPHLSSLTPHDGTELLVCPIASEPLRAFPESLLLASLELWRARSRATIVFSGAPRDAAALHRISRLAGERAPGPVEVAAADDFDAFLARVASAGAVLAAESGPAHLATALDKRAVIAVGGGTHGLCAPWRRSSRQTTVEHRIPCYHCGWLCTQSEVLCLTQLSPPAIANALPAL